jgi:hypothetical protein
MKANYHRANLRATTATRGKSFNVVQVVIDLTDRKL